jgi:hypothetical protein
VTFKKRNAKYSLFAFGVYVAGQVCHRNIRWVECVYLYICGGWWSTA